MSITLLNLNRLCVEDTDYCAFIQGGSLISLVLFYNRILSVDDGEIPSFGNDLMFCLSYSYMIPHFCLILRIRIPSLETFLQSRASGLVAMLCADE